MTTNTQTTDNKSTSLVDDFPCDECKHGAPYSYSKVCITCNLGSGYEPKTTAQVSAIT